MDDLCGIDGYILSGFGLQKVKLLGAALLNFWRYNISILYQRVSWISILRAL